MTWTHQLIKLYHGTTLTGAASIRTQGIDPKYFKTRTDFGPGFYMTTFWDQAEDWACHQARRSRLAGNPVNGAVVEFSIQRNRLGALLSLSFVRPEDSHRDFWDLILHCRAGNHHSLPGSPPNLYDVVYGPVADNWRFRPYTCHVGYDQISFHTSVSWKMLHLTTVHNI